MRRSFLSTIGVIAAVAAVLSVLQADFTPGWMSASVADAQTSSTCSLSAPAFCETFSAPAGTGNRSGQLNGTLWGVSRTTGNNNFGQHLMDAWSPSALTSCGGTTNVRPDSDVVVCNGQLREATDDNEQVTVLAMYPKQPFDFASRTGSVTFDVSNDTQGSHAAWPELWITDKPTPAPFTHFGTWASTSQNAFGLRLFAVQPPNKGALLSSNCPNDGHIRWTVGSVAVVRNYVVDDQDNGGSTRVTPLDCVISSSGPGNMNHVMVQVSQSQIDVYATDAGTVAPLHHIAVVQNAKLSFTRGLVWLEDVHYNANKFGTQGTHTFSWANLGFDGPLLPRDLSYDVNDRLQANSDGTLNLGWSTSPVPSFTINNVTNPQNASGALFMANVYAPSSPVSFTYSVNGHTHTAAWPFPDTTAVSWRAVAFPVPLSDIVAGTNTLSISGSQTIGVANINLVLVGAGGKVAPAAGAPPTATPRPAPATATPTPTRAPQSAATPTPNAASFQLHATANPTSVHRGSAVAFTLSAKSIPSSDVLVDLEVYTSAGTKVFQQFWDNQSFTAGQTRTYSTRWSVPATAAPGSYRVGVGVFSRGWGHTYTWVNTAASVTVQ